MNRNGMKKQEIGMKKNKFQNIFSGEIEIPAIVRKKTESALAAVRREAAAGSREEQGMKQETKKRIFQSWTSVAAAITGAAMLGGGVVFAAANHFWSDGLTEVFEVEETQAKILQDQGNLQVFDDTQAVTVNGVTIRPLEMVADESRALFTFLVTGPDAEALDQGLMFDQVHLELDDGSFGSMSGSFYNEPVTDENGEIGLEYVVYYNAWLLEGNNLLGHQMHVSFEDLALPGGKAEAGETLTKGVWTFDITLPEESYSIVHQVSQPLEGTVYTVDRVEISPLSLKVYYQVDGEVEIGRWDNNVPLIQGIRLKDGTILDITATLASGYPALARNLGHLLYGDRAPWEVSEEEQRYPEGAYTDTDINQMIDPEDVAEVILQPWGEAYAWGDLPDEVVAEEYGGEIPFERINPEDVEYWHIMLQ